jgi:hypothetical protein
MLCFVQALAALRDYIPLHIYHNASDHLFGNEELKPCGATDLPELRPEYAHLRAYASGHIEVCAANVCFSRALVRMCSIVCARFTFLQAISLCYK